MPTLTRIVFFMSLVIGFKTSKTSQTTLMAEHKTIPWCTQYISANSYINLNTSSDKRNYSSCIAESLCTSFLLLQRDWGKFLYLQMKIMYFVTWIPQYMYSKVFLSFTNKYKVTPRYWKPFQKIPLSVEENIATLFHWHLDSAIYNKFFLSFPHINTGDLIRKFLYL